MTIKTQLINEKISSNVNAFIAESESNVMQQIESVAKQVVGEQNEKPIIFISGPSGSSKTTTAIKLSQAIKAQGFNVCYISMDNYFKDFSNEERELNRLGKIDLESPNRLNIEALNSDIEALAENKTIFESKYNFANNIRNVTEKTLCRDNGFVIIEGIHALNEDLFSSTDDISNRIYVSVRTRVVDSNNDKLHPCKIRLMRRMMRDKAYRGRSVEETIKMFQKVQYGENKYIMPYKHRANYDIDTFVSYEANVYKDYLYDSLVQLAPKYSDVRDVVNALDELQPIDNSLIPNDAMIREFIGGSSLKY